MGSNMLERRNFLEKAAVLVNSRVGHILRQSRIRESESWGFVSNPFLNQVLEVETDLTPEQVLTVTQQIERELGRTEKSGRGADGNPVYHARTIDVDLLWFEGEVRDGEDLTLPHPHVAEREFILVLLAEMYDDRILPPFTCSFREMLDALAPMD